MLTENPRRLGNQFTVVWFILVLLLAGLLWVVMPRAEAQASAPALVPVTGHFSDGSGNPTINSYLDAVLQGCGGNPPRVFGSFTVLKGEVQLPIDPTVGTISGALTANDKINCGGATNTTDWWITPVVNGVAQGPATCYQVSSTGQVPFNFDTAQPCLSVMPPPGPPSPGDGYFVNLTLTGLLSGVNATFTGTVNANCFFEQSAGPEDLCNYPGADYGAQINAAEAGAGTAAHTWIVNKDGAATTPFSLAPNHHLKVNAHLSLGTQGTLSSHNHIGCDVGGLITSTMGGGSQLFLLADGAVDESITDCFFEANFGTVLYNPGHTVDLDLEHNDVHNGSLFQQQSASAQAPSARFRSKGNNIHFDTPNPGIIGELLYGATQDFTIDNDTCTGPAHCHEAYAIDGGTFPSYAQIAAEGLSHGNITHTRCKDVYDACDWTSGADFVTIGQGSTANHCGDVCFDHEAAGHVKTDGATCVRGDAGCFTIFFVSTASSITNSNCSVTTGPCVALKNAQQANLGNLNNTLISNIVMDVLTPNTVGTFALLDSNSGTTIQNSQVGNGTLLATGYSAGLAVKTNTFTFTVPTNAGLDVPSLRNGALNVFQGNIIQSLYAQGQAAGTPGIAATNVDFNFHNTLLITGNTTLGWPVDITVANQGGNVPATFDLYDNLFGSGSIVEGTSNAQVILSCANNHSIATPQLSCPN